MELKPFDDKNACRSIHASPAAGSMKIAANEDVQRKVEEEEELDDIVDPDTYEVFKYSVRRRLECDVLYAKKKIELENKETEDSLDSNFGLRNSDKVLRFMKHIVPPELLNVYRKFTLTGQFLENLYNKNLRTDYNACKILLYEFVGLNDKIYEKVLEGLWITKHDSVVGYERWQGRDLAEKA